MENTKNSLKTIMVVDDSASDQFIATHAIESYDAQITILQAHDGIEALEIIEKKPQKPDLILLDINMPRMNGHEFLKVYEEKYSDLGSIIIMLTSSDQEKDIALSETYNFVKEYIHKPLDSKKFTDVISRCL